MAQRPSDSLIDPTLSDAEQIARLLDVTDALIRHAEQDHGAAAGVFERFRRAAGLEELVRQRTHDLEATLHQLSEAKAGAERARRDLGQAIEAVEMGFAMFDMRGRLVMHNSRFCRDLSDIRPFIVPGLGFEDYVALISLSKALVLPPGMTPAGWMRHRMQHHREGQRLNVELVGDVWLQVSEQRTADHGIVILQTDITDTIRAERQERRKLLDQQGRVIHATLEHINQGVAIYGAAGRLVGRNHRFGALLDLPEAALAEAATLTGLGALLARQAAFGDDFAPERLMEWARASGRRPPIRFEMKLGTGVVLDAFGQGMPDRGCVISLTDVTRERMAIHSMLRANASLEQRVAARTSDLAVALREAELAHAARGRFVAAASHDLLQPLSAAKLFVAAARDMAPPGRPAETLAKAQNALISVEAILGALLDISRLEGAGAEIDAAPITLAVLLSQLADEFVPVALQRGLDLRIVPCSLTVTSDPAYLRRILQNLISNALRYTQTGRVLVGVRRLGRSLRIEVHDTGPGIAPEDQRKIFGEFQRLQGSASAAEGMGLGLAIVERACALLKHPLTLRSEPGRGTTFGVEMPCAPAAPKHPAPRPPPIIAEEPGDNTDRIALLVENDADLRKAIALHLEHRGVSVLEAESGEAALALLDEIGIVPDLYLIDQQLGAGLTGIETARALQDQFGDRPIRLITANRDPQLRLAAQAAGLEILFKPIDTDALEAFIRPGS